MHIAAHIDAGANGELALSLFIDGPQKREKKKLMIPGRIRGSILNQIFKFVNRNYVGTTFLFSLLADAVAWFVLTMQRILYFDKPFLTTGFYLFNFQFLYFSVHLFFSSIYLDPFLGGRSVVRQSYDVRVEGKDVFMGNVAFLRCIVPDHVRDFVAVTAWYREDVVLLPERADTCK